MSDSVITEMTDAKENILKDCIIQRDRELNEKYINSRLCNLGLFYKL